ncbi:MAG: GNAT family N-acetyltransferase [Dehalococcoidia bacterium]
MKMRPYRETDISELADIVNKAYSDEYEFIPYTDEDLLGELKPASTVLLATDEQDRIVGLAYLRQDWYGETVTTCARPGTDWQKIEGFLLTAIEPENKTGNITTSVEPDDRERMEFFDAGGYRPQSSLYQMVVDLDRPVPCIQLPEGYTVRSLKPDEEQTLIRLANAAYKSDRLQPGVLAKWQARDPDFKIDWVQVAEYEGELVAMVRGCSDREYNEHYDARRGYLGPAATLSDHRGKGLSKILTARAMDCLRHHGMHTACLYTWEGNPAAVELTRHLGFRLGHEWKILGKRLPRT